MPSTAEGTLQYRADVKALLRSKPPASEAEVEAIYLRYADSYLIGSWSGPWSRHLVMMCSHRHGERRQHRIMRLCASHPMIRCRYWARLVQQWSEEGIANPSVTLWFLADPMLGGEFAGRDWLALARLYWVKDPEHHLASLFYRRWVLLTWYKARADIRQDPDNIGNHSVVYQMRAKDLWRTRWSFKA